MFAPLYKGLSIENFLEAARQHQAVMDYLPDKRDLPRLPRQLIINVLHTVIGEPIRQMIKEVIKRRNE